ncbi:UNVERIFIED_CONTAM: hypothetical protein RKD50_000558 [Streptomyces canus]
MPERLVVLYRGNRPPATALIERLTDTVYATEEELPYLLPGADALLAWVTITPAIREAWPDNPDKAPRWVHAASAGVDSFLFPALVANPLVTLANSSRVYGEPISEYTLPDPRPRQGPPQHLGAPAAPRVASTPRREHQRQHPGPVRS